MMLSGCSWLSSPADPNQYIAVEDQTPRPTTPTSIQISYAKPNDTLQSVVVSQFTGASILGTSGEGDKQSLLVRFDGGVPIWKFHSARSMLNPISAIEKTPYHVTDFEYGKLPRGFEQEVPEVGPPPPLDAGGYYIFAITRASGAISYQAVHARPDLTLQVFDAEPRAGTSYSLCCGVSDDFAVPSPSNAAAPAPAQDSDQQ